jgi:hypothetical protein
MKSIRVWLCTLALSTVIIFSVPTVKAQVPYGFTYQGQLEDNGVPMSGNITFVVSISDKNGNVVYSETFANVVITDGNFSVVIGGPAPFPASMTFNEPYIMQETVMSSNGTTILAPTQLWSAPYAINSGTVNGLSASPVPVAGELFPVPIGTGYTGSAKMDPAFLPPSASSGATEQSTPADPAGTTSTTPVQMGLAGSITPATSGKVMIIISGRILNTTALGESMVQISYGAGTAPVNGVAATGTIAGNQVLWSLPPAGSPPVPFTTNAVVTGLTLGTPYWIDLQLQAAGGKAYVESLSISAIEVP